MTTELARLRIRDGLALGDCQYLLFAVVYPDTP